MDSMGNVFWALCGLFSLGLGSLLIGLQAYLFLSTRDMDEWLIAPGTIIVSRIKQQQSVFIPEIHYRYSVSGREFERSGIDLNGKQTFSPQVAQDWIAQYPVGKQVDVFYHPTNPKMAALEKGYSLRSTFYASIAPLVMTAFGAFILYMQFVR